MKKTKLAIAVATSSLISAVSQQAAAEFVKDSKAILGLRNFYYNNDNHDGGMDERQWAQAFRLDYVSGFTQGTVGFGVDLQGLLGVHLDGGKGYHPDSSSFTPSETDGSSVDEWSRVGATAKARISKTELRYGNTLMPNLPILIANDSRMLPQTFEGGIVTSNDIDNLTLSAGDIAHVAGRASSNYTPLSVAGGTEGSNQFRFVGGDWKVTQDLTLQYYYSNLEDYFKQHFGGLVHVLPIGEGQSLKTDLRYFKSSSDGKNGDPGFRFNNNGGYASNPGEVDNNTWSAMFTYSVGSHAITLGHQRVSDDGGFVWVNQGSLTNDAGHLEGAGGANFYLFTDSIVNQFARAGENTTFGNYTFDFVSLGLPGLKASVSYLHGDDIRDISGVGSHKEWERDERLDYAFQDGTLKGLSVSLRHGIYRGYAGAANPDIDQSRLILNYTLPLF